MTEIQVMLGKLMQKTTRSITRRLGFEIVRGGNPVRTFHSDNYLRHNARRLEHLASLGIPVSNTSVLEVGAGIGDHSHYYLDRGCHVTITEAREENLTHLRSRYPECTVLQLDMDAPVAVAGAPFDVVHCYGLLYHLGKPAEALAFLAQQTSGLLFLETCVSFGDELAVHLTGEPKANPTQAYSGMGCRPTRSWVHKELSSHFEHVYLPLTQQCHSEFPIDWSAPKQHQALLQRAIFIASRQPIDNPLLTTELVTQQKRHQ